MTGFILQVDNKYISGAIKEGITSILLTLKEDRFKLYFGSLDKSGMHSYIWYATDLKIGDRLKISFTNIISLSKPQEVVNYNSLDEDKLDLDYYHRLKKELIQEGLLSDDI
jgi:hypothetical protein